MTFIFIFYFYYNLAVYSWTKPVHMQLKFISDICTSGCRVWDGRKISWQLVKGLETRQPRVGFCEFWVWGMTGIQTVATFLWNNIPNMRKFIFFFRLIHCPMQMRRKSESRRDGEVSERRKWINLKSGKRKMKNVQAKTAGTLPRFMHLLCASQTKFLPLSGSFVIFWVIRNFPMGLDEGWSARVGGLVGGCLLRHVSWLLFWHDYTIKACKYPENPVALKAALLMAISLTALFAIFPTTQ